MVAPYVGAWIETPCTCSRKPAYTSHPTWVRGLKRHLSHKSERELRSHPTWVRGLKQDQPIYLHKAVLVAPYVGAWIETKGKTRPREP